jgi:hypothetical protein
MKLDLVTDSVVASTAVGFDSAAFIELNDLLKKV